MPLAADARFARSLGARIRALREEIGITQETLAWDCELAKPYLSQIESGKRIPSLQVLVALAARLGVHPADLLVTDLNDARMALLEATRRKDVATVEAALRKLGLHGRK